MARDGSRSNHLGIPRLARLTCPYCHGRRLLTATELARHIAEAHPGNDPVRDLNYDPRGWVVRTWEKLQRGKV